MKKKILPILLFSLSTFIYGQDKGIKKPIVIPSDSIEVVFTDIEEILEHKELGLSKRQEAVFKVKNEYVKRDLKVLNDRTDMLPVEKNETEKKIKESYVLFIERTLSNSQLDLWSKIKKESEFIAPDNGLKSDIKDLNDAFKDEQKEIYDRYKSDRKIFAAQRKVRFKRKEKSKAKLVEYYNTPVEDNNVMSLEEIKILMQELDTSLNDEESIDSKFDY
ncbi:hypothetical protein NWE55_16670 (plasmid) [Myroides albus]|uniref:Uncharacterized protein n=1 Tax=Myroides odoratimimus TaxID=76832 RepID=A0AAI8C7K4_9FLAO|nr:MULTISPECIES: hypothetical protein [Myroides]ALU28459.1 hypothetical protein AS202_19960 [Myroides odoratimimus]UVD81395.1 hypothetical protein NWE55_16670 [Myroides albus]